MTISITDSEASYDADGTNSTFYIKSGANDIAFGDPSEIEVLVDGVVVSSSEYFVSGSIQDIPGGSKVYTAGVVAFNAAPASGNKITIQRNTAHTQTAPLTRGGSFDPATLEEMSDKATRAIQDLARQVGAASEGTGAATDTSALQAQIDALEDSDYLGKQASDPTADLKNDPISQGNWYWNTTNKVYRRYDGTAWADKGTGPGTGITQADADNRYAPIASAGVTQAYTDANYAPKLDTANITLDLGVAETYTLPAIASVPDEQAITVYATGDPSGFQTAKVIADGTDTFVFRGEVIATEFHLIGGGERLRFTRYGAAWFVSVISQPKSRIAVLSSGLSGFVTGSGSWTNANTAILTQDAPIFQTAANGQISLPVAGEYGYAASGMARSLSTTGRQVYQRVVEHSHVDTAFVTDQAYSLLKNTDRKIQKAGDKVTHQINIPTTAEVLRDESTLKLEFLGR